MRGMVCEEEGKDIGSFSTVPRGEKTRSCVSWTEGRNRGGGSCIYGCKEVYVGDLHFSATLCRAPHTHTHKPERSREDP